MKKKVILVTDGDGVAQQAVEVASKNIGGRTISRSAGNPTPLSGKEIVELIKLTPYDPVVVMVDDCGNPGIGDGEKALGDIINDPEIVVLGVVAVASNTKDGEGAKVDFSITDEGEVIDWAVDKNGKVKGEGKGPKKVIVGDTISLLDKMNVPLVVGIGDPGKMHYHDNVEQGAPITTRAFKEIIQRSKYSNGPQ